MTDLPACLELEPEGGVATGAVIWMHGLGADGHDFEPIVPILRCPRARFVFPHAPSMPVTINGGFVMPAWYDITSLEDDDRREDPEHVVASGRRVADLIGREIERGVPPERIVLAGFSQGAAMALYVAPRYPQPLAGVLALSGYLVLPSRLEAEALEANRATPMLIAHGRLDPMVPIALGQRAHATLQRWSTSGDVQWHEFPIAHEVSVPEIELVGQWLRERLG
jgi:phospholipase/carboxylesterase